MCRRTRQTTRPESRSLKPYKLETAALYLGAAGLGLAHGLVPQLILLGCAIYRLGVDPEARRLRLTLSNGVLLALGAWMLLSTIPAVSRFDAWGGTVGMALSVWVTLAAISRVMADTNGLGGRLVKVFLASATLGAIYALSRFAVFLTKHVGLPRAELPFAGCNAAGTVLAAAVLVALGCLKTTKRSERVMLTAAIPILVAALIATQSRGAFVALVAGLAVFGLRSKRRLVLGLIPLTVLLAVFIQVYPPVASRYASILSPMANKDRLEIWRTALLMIRDHPVLGIGVNNFEDVYLHYPHPDVFNGSQPFAHNVFLEIGAAAGIPGLLAFVALVVTAIRAGLQAWGRPGVGHVAAVALAVFAALLAHLQFDLTLYSGNLLPLFFS
ncbi:MAG: O-antigen ligase family protein, partial [Bacillota bacterium]